MIQEQNEEFPSLISEFGEDSSEVHDFNAKFRERQYSINQRMFAIDTEIEQLNVIPDGQLTPIELSNLTRLGILRSIPLSFATGHSQSKASKRIQVNVYHDGFYFVVTELGLEFFKLCGEIEKPASESSEL